MNLVLSPLVVSGALSLAAAGATDGGSAQRELLETLGIASHADFAALCRSVLSGEGASLRIANGVFTRPAIKPDYVSLIQSVHGARAEPLGPSYGPVNKWVEDATEGKIRDLLSDPVRKASFHGALRRALKDGGHSLDRWTRLWWRCWPRRSSSRARGPRSSTLPPPRPATSPTLTAQRIACR